MTPRARIAIIVVALSGIIGAFLVAKGSDGDDPGAPVATSEPAPVANTPHAEPAATVPVTTPAAKPAAPATVVIDVRGGKPRGGVKTLRFRKGQRVRFSVRSDAADEVHVHGYDKTKALTPGRTVKFDFKATIEGRFEVELEGAGAAIAELEVSPA